MAVRPRADPHALACVTVAADIDDVSVMHEAVDEGLWS